MPITDTDGNPVRGAPRRTAGAFVVRLVAIARLVRDGRSAEIAFEVANDYQQRGIGSALTEELLADARAAGITEITALVSSDNPAAVALLRRTLDALDISLEGPDLWIRAAIPRLSRKLASSNSDLC